MASSKRAHFTSTLVSLASLALPLAGCGEAAELESLAEADLELRHAGNLADERIASGNMHTCVVVSNGTVRCWGDGAQGQLGNGDWVAMSTPVQVSGLSSVIAVTAGNAHSCALRADGTVRCWGSNLSGQLGDGSGSTKSATPVTVSGLSGVTSISAGDYHTCATLSDGTAKCWGLNSSGQLGDGSTYNRPTPVSVSPLSNVVAVEAGGAHTCALITNGTAKCWGKNDRGQVGDGTFTTPRTQPVSVTGTYNVIAVSAGKEHSCALLESGGVQCWGGNDSGELGNNAVTESHTPMSVTGLSGGSTISAGDGKTCVRRSDGTARCWGQNYEGQLGNGSTVWSSTPVTVSGLSGATAIRAEGRYHACALRADGTVHCWGNNDWGQLGNVSVPFSSTTPVAVDGLSGGSTGAHIAMGSYHSCALRPDGTAACWGRNSSGQLGDGSNVDRDTPVTVSGVSNAISIIAGMWHSCALLADGTARCWGYGYQGQLGNGFAETRWTPVMVNGLSSAVDMVGGGGHTCALLSTGSVHCWGDNDNYQLGDGSNMDRLTPVYVSSISTATAIAAGNNHTCALLTSGIVKCWGANNLGQLGNGTDDPYTSPVTVIGVSNAIGISAGMNHTCALLANGELRCWGHHYYGQLGDGSSDIKNATPVAVSGISDAVGLSAGDNHTCAILSGGSLKCWGDNSGGQLGDNTKEQRRTPVRVLSGPQLRIPTYFALAASVEAGGQHTCALRGSGVIRCWGQNSDGQLGNGTNDESLVPVSVIGFP